MVRVVKSPEIDGNDIGGVYTGEIVTKVWYEDEQVRDVPITPPKKKRRKKKPTTKRKPVATDDVKPINFGKTL